MVAARGMRLTMRTPLVSARRSRYSPGSTTTELPGTALASAAAIESDGVTTICAPTFDAVAILCGGTNGMRQPAHKTPPTEEKP